MITVSDLIKELESYPRDMKVHVDGGTIQSVYLTTTDARYKNSNHLVSNLMGHPIQEANGGYIEKIVRIV